MTKTAELAALSDSIREQAGMVLGSTEQVREDCRRISELVELPPSRRDLEFLHDLAGVLRECDDSIIQPVSTFLGSVVRDQARPWLLLKRLLDAADSTAAAEAVSLAFDLIEAGHLPLRTPVLKEFSRLLDLEIGPFEDEDLTARLAGVIDRCQHPARPVAGGGLTHLLSHGAGTDLRRMAARLLDLDGGSVPDETAREILGPAAYDFFRSYLEFTLATHTDLFLLSGGKRLPRTLVDMFRRAEQDHGQNVVRTAIVTLGWKRVRLGLKIQPYVEMCAPGNLPVPVRPEEVELFDDGMAAAGEGYFLVTAHGGRPYTARGRRDPNDPIDRFRVMNIAHAELLREIIDVVPLDRDKVEHIVSTLDGIVETFHFLFRDAFAECTILPEVWRRLRDRALDELEAQADAGNPSPELTRLILAFEDPANLGEVRTLHGLKRFLHQKGLKLGFELVGADRAPDRTVSLLLIRDGGATVHTAALRYAEFETGCEADPEPWLPWPVRMAAEGLAWQLLHGTESFPGVEIFLFGNEVHHYISFRNHPVFLRIDYSPPQRGGMFDLEYYGVSNYELDLHPNIQLDAISAFFRSLEFDVQVQGTRLFVRYDKERSSDLGNLLERAEALFRLVPFLMDVDWLIGSLQLSSEMRQVVARHWAKRFIRSGVLPVNRILNNERSGILIDRDAGPTGVQDTLWDGKGPYVDRYSGPVPDGFLQGLRGKLVDLGLRVPSWSAGAEAGPLPLLELEHNILAPLRAALARGQVLVTGNGLRRTPSRLFQLEHEADLFAAVLAGNGSMAREAVALSRPLSELDPFVKFETTGFIGGLTVEKAKVVVRGGEIAVYVVRDGHGVIRLGMYAIEGVLFRRRSRPGGRWRSNLCCDSVRFWSLLHGANYVSAAAANVSLDTVRDLAELQAAAALDRPARNTRHEGARRILNGLTAAPGRAVGHVVFGTEGRQPADLEGAVLVAREMRPTDNPFLFRAAGVISTGGAVLSHAALLAIQYGKPAVLAAGRWAMVGHKPALNFSVAVQREQERETGRQTVRILEVTEERTETLVEGDLVILDADAGTVEILGQSRDIAVLWENFKLLGEAGGRSTLTTGDTEVMEIRAQQLRARHQIQKVLGRITDPTAASFAVEELVIGRSLAGIKTADRTRLLSILTRNESVAETVTEKLAGIIEHLTEGCRASAKTCLERIPSSRFLYEIVGLRLRSLRRHEALSEARELLQGCGLPEGHAVIDGTDPACSAATRRLHELAGELLAELDGSGPTTRHLLRRIRRIGLVLGELPGGQDAVQERVCEQDASDTRKVAAADRAWVLPAAACGFETNPHVGWKAANLGEMDRLSGASIVPPWFVVTDHAFREMLSCPVDTSLLPAGCLDIADVSLGRAIDMVLQAKSLEIPAKSICIRALWQAADLPPELVSGVEGACAAVMDSRGEETYLAVRSSSCDEDTETEMRAGEFETYLFVRGVDSVLEHLKLTWGGFWTERALYSRRSAGDLMRRPAGGVIVQRMIGARVSGVLQTVNVGHGDLQELLINVGLGLGEGIVSGRVSADLVTVVKDIAPGDDPVHFNYLTNDKPEQIVFDEKRGRGTRLDETLYHQRLRPAIEYTELCEITRMAIDLENAYGYPLDIEFAIEGPRLWLLQARPIAVFSTELRETLERYPMDGDPPTVATAGVPN